MIKAFFAFIIYEMPSRSLPSDKGSQLEKLKVIIFVENEDTLNADYLLRHF